MTFHFGLTGDDVERMPRGEVQVYIEALEKLPPPGWVFMGTPKK